MSTTPNPYQPSNSFTNPAPSNGVGITGFILSIISIFTCGVLSVLSLPISLIGLLWKPRGFAIAGTIISLGGTAMLALIGWGFVATFLGLKEAVTTAGKGLQTSGTLGEAKSIIENYRLENNKLPDGVEGNKLLLEKKDGWEQNLRDEPTGDTYVIRSGGPDMKYDTPDDLTSDADSFDTEPPMIETGVPGIPGVEGPFIIPPDESAPTTPPTDGEKPEDGKPEDGKPEEE